MRSLSARLERGECSGVAQRAAPESHGRKSVVRGLPFGLTHIVVVVRIAIRKLVLTAYGIEKEGGG